MWHPVSTQANIETPAFLQRQQIPVHSRSKPQLCCAADGRLAHPTPKHV